jgi:hypothetical protein
MLEKLAEIIRGEVREAGLSVEVPCIACDKRPYGSDACSADNFCPNVATPEGSLSLARWAVLLVAKGLESWEEYEKAGIEYERAVQEWEKARGAGAPMDEVVCAKDKAFAQWTELDGMVMTELINLIAEAKEDTNVSSGEEQMCQAEEETNDAV